MKRTSLILLLLFGIAAQPALADETSSSDKETTQPAEETDAKKPDSGTADPKPSDKKEEEEEPDCE